MPAAALSSTTPAYLWVPPGSVSDSADEACDLAVSLGFDVGQPERDVLGVLLSEAPDGTWATLETAVVCARQNVKTWALLMTVLHDLYLRDVKRVTWSAHLFKTTQDAFNQLDGLIGDTDWMRKRVRRARRSAGQEGFDFTNGASIDFLARSKGAGRGLSGNTVILDEALYLSTATQGALIPTLSAQRNPHVRYGSSPGVLESEALRSIRDRGRAGSDPSLSYIEYTSPQEPCADEHCTHRLGSRGCQLDDESKWAQANPALGRRISVQYVRDERRALAADPVEFMRERMGWWQDPPNLGGGVLFPMDDWAECLDEDSTIPDGAPLVFAVDVSWDRSLAHVGVAGVREDGLYHVQEIAVMDPNDVRGWLAARVRRFMPLAVTLQGSGAPASSLAQELDAEGLPLRLLNGADMARGTGFLHDAIRAGRVRHDGAASLTQQVSTAVGRQIGDGVVIDRKKSPIDTGGVTAVMEALWVLDGMVGSSGYDVASSVH